MRNRDGKEARLTRFSRSGMGGRHSLHVCVNDACARRRFSPPPRSGFDDHRGNAEIIAWRGPARGRGRAADTRLTLAFDILARETTHPDPGILTALVQLLSRASGIGGMAGGQMLDLEAEGRFTPDGKALSFSVEGIERLQAMKTGALLAAACEAGAVLGKAKPAEGAALKTYARAFGLAFQIADDLLDAEGDANVAGKRVGKDESRGKATLVAKLGTADARTRLITVVTEAVAALSAFGPRAAMLEAAARFVATRQH